ncbi:alpha/beta hydrolase-fold protein [Spirosoma endophyticum]|uniref:Uncharacterized protein n=1 Tax=Spirosoma endophyticum TaxID=662367 RepID=A0A1I1Z9I3_9BACT|nr:alpha/beta hydrolase-fold protein [Spirosoma endophyticum]SFE28347.1 hypothetical protein SAMN05216167_11254 [Spirosoma endophyticum]
MRFDRFCLLLFLLLSFTTQSQPIGTVSIGSEHTLISRVLGEERHYFINLPASYQKDEFYTDKKYPVLILLDADTNFRFASSMIQFMSAGETEQIPEMIVVAVVNTARTRDMTTGLGGQKDSFLTFLESELLPQIDQQYRTLPYRVLVGHSLAGLFALNCFLQQRAFQAYIAIDPTLTWGQNAVIKKATPILTSNQSVTSTLFLAQANNPFEPGQHTGLRGNAFDTFRALLIGNQSKHLAHQYMFYPQENHYSVPLQSFRDGLLFVFSGYEFPIQTFLDQGSMSIVSHYKRFTERLGTVVLSPGKVINQMGHFLLQSQKQVDQALQLFKLNEAYYPHSVVTYNSLGEAYKLKGDKQTAIRYYEKSLALDTSNEKANKALQKLK